MSEAPDIWKRRFAALMLARLAATMLVLLGLVIGFGDLVVPGGNRLAGLLIAAAGVVALVHFPALLRRRWGDR